MNYCTNEHSSKHWGLNSEHHSLTSRTPMGMRDDKQIMYNIMSDKSSMKKDEGIDLKCGVVVRMVNICLFHCADDI